MGQVDRVLDSFVTGAGWSAHLLSRRRVESAEGRIRCPDRWKTPSARVSPAGPPACLRWRSSAGADARSPPVRRVS